MKSIGNIASKIHVSPKLNLKYKCRRRFRLSLNKPAISHDVIPRNTPKKRARLD